MHKILSRTQGVSVTTWTALIVVLTLTMLAVLAPWIAPYGQAEIAGKAYQGPGAHFWLGTDQVGRDLFSRLLFASRNTIFLALICTSLSFGVGVLCGMYAAMGNWLAERALVLITETILSIPSLIFAMLLLAVFGQGFFNLVLIIAMLDSARVFRLARALSINVLVMEYVEAARLRGEGFWWIGYREIYPAIVSQLAAEFGIRFCFVFLTISALSFLGLGLQPPTADLGSMVADSKTLIVYGNPAPLIPAATIALLTIAINFVVDGFFNRSKLRDL